MVNRREKEKQTNKIHRSRHMKMLAHLHILHIDNAGINIIIEMIVLFRCVRIGIGPKTI